MPKKNDKMKTNISKGVKKKSMIKTLGALGWT
jgi:hypothetical protein